MIRAFLALNFSVATTRRIAEEVEKHKAAVAEALKVNWVPAANLHVTLQFLGMIEEELVEGIAGRLKKLAHAPFEVKAKGLGAFPSHVKPSVLWVGVDGGSALVTLQREVEAAMVGLGFPKEERAYHPHITVGRVKEQRADVPFTWASDVDLGGSTMNEIVVYQSKTAGKGSEYIARARVPIAK
jgi:RNA 2',3'-cyclic 3'-phosphodiesterase